MGSIPNTVYYCCVSTGSRLVYEYNGGDHEISKMAVLCLERAPQHHKWYFQTMCKRTFGFLMEDGYVYFVIVHECVGSAGALKFLEHVRDEFKKAAKKSSKKSLLNSQGLQEQLVPVIRRLIISLQQVSKTSDDWPTDELTAPHIGQGEVGSSTNAPLLGKSGKQDKRKSNDHVIGLRDEGFMEEHRMSSDRGMMIDSGTMNSSDQSGPMSSISLQKESSVRMRSSLRKKWCRLVRKVLAVDAVLCLVLFVIWISICRGTSCLR